MNESDTKIISQKKIEANRRNGALSAEPKTAEGKAVSRMNAVKHGIFARQLLVRGWKIKRSGGDGDKRPGMTS